MNYFELDQQFVNVENGFVALGNLLKIQDYAQSHKPAQIACMEEFTGVSVESLGETIGKAVRWVVLQLRKLVEWLAQFLSGFIAMPYILIKLLSRVFTEAEVPYDVDKLAMLTDEVAEYERDNKTYNISEYKKFVDDFVKAATPTKTMNKINKAIVLGIGSTCDVLVPTTAMVTKQYIEAMKRAIPVLQRFTKTGGWDEVTGKSGLSELNDEIEALYKADDQTKSLAKLERGGEMPKTVPEAIDVLKNLTSQMRTITRENTRLGTTCVRLVNDIGNRVKTAGSMIHIVIPVPEEIRKELQNFYGGKDFKLKQCVISSYGAFKAIDAIAGYSYGPGDGKTGAIETVWINAKLLTGLWKLVVGALTFKRAFLRIFVHEARHVYDGQHGDIGKVHNGLTDNKAYRESKHEVDARKAERNFWSTPVVDKWVKEVQTKIKEAFAKREDYVMSEGDAKRTVRDLVK